MNLFKRAKRTVVERRPPLHSIDELLYGYKVTGELFQAQLSDAVAMVFSLGWCMQMYAKWVAISGKSFVLVDGWICELTRDRWGIGPDGKSAEATFRAFGKHGDPMRAIMAALGQARRIEEEDPDFRSLYMDVNPVEQPG